MRTVTDVERRHRLAAPARARPAHRVADPVAATRGDDRAARDRAGDGLPLALGRASTASRSPTSTGRCTTTAALVKQLAMRRTLFVFPRDLLPAAWGSASARVARRCAPRLAKEVEAAGLADDGAAWLAAARGRDARPARRRQRARRRPRSASRCPSSTARLDVAPGTTYAANVPVAPARADPARRRGARSSAAATAATGAPPARSGRDDDLAGRGAGAAPGAARGTPSWSRRWLRTLRARHRRPTWCGGWAPPKAAVRRGARRPRGRRGRRSTAAAPAWRAARRRCDRSPRRRRRAVGGAAARARPDRDGLEGARLLPRPARPAALRHATATPAPPLVGRPDRRLLGAGPRRRGALRLLEDVGADGRGALEAEAERLTGLAGRRPGQHGLPVDSR